MNFSSLQTAESSRDFPSLNQVDTCEVEIFVGVLASQSKFHRVNQGIRDYFEPRYVILEITKNAGLHAVCCVYRVVCRAAKVAAVFALTGGVHFLALHICSFLWI